MSPEEYERSSLKLASDAQAELRDALNSLGGKTGNGLIENYLLYTAAHINRAVEGYIHLREAQRFESSKLLIRTAIESLFRIKAVQTKPELLFRIAFSEFEEDKKWVKALKGADAAEVLQEIDKQAAEFEQEYRSQHPGHTIIKEKISSRDLAKSSNIAPYYDSHYRLYCRFTHGAVSAILGELTELQREDNRVMTLCALTAIEALVSFGATASNLSSLKDRSSELIPVI